MRARVVAAIALPSRRTARLQPSLSRRQRRRRLEALRARRGAAAGGSGRGARHLRRVACRRGQLCRSVRPANGPRASAGSGATMRPTRRRAMRLRATSRSVARSAPARRDRSAIPGRRSCAARALGSDATLTLFERDAAACARLTVALGDERAGRRDVRRRPRRAAGGRRRRPRRAATPWSRSSTRPSRRSRIGSPCPTR